ncbi:hypothetical protein LTR85_009210 [Meristemomyces frigidus]|nr:hypothetical protein LTR85_009210 [Meristemomyces frigidus]
MQGADLFDLMGYSEDQSNKLVEDRRQCLNAYRALARVNRQTHGDVEKIFFEQNQFEFWVIDVHVAVQLGEWLHRVDESFIARMRRLRIVQALQAADGLHDITLPRHGDLYTLRWNGEPCRGEPNDCIKATTAYGAGAYSRNRESGGLDLGDAMTAATRQMRTHAKHHRHKLLRLDPNVTRPYVNHAVERARGRTRERLAPLEFCIPPELLRRILCKVIPEGALDVPLGRVRFPCRPGSGCISPDYCWCDDCEDYKYDRTKEYNVDVAKRRAGADEEGDPFLADYSWPWRYHSRGRRSLTDRPSPVR